MTNKTFTTSKPVADWLKEQVPTETLIQHCYKEHVRDIGEVNFSYADYRAFWVNHSANKTYTMVNRDKSVVECKVAYYPLPYYKDLRALIEINKGDYNDYREVPIRFLTPSHTVVKK